MTQNYVRYPVYSCWKTKEKTITKSIKLTNLVLENLNSNTDELIRKFADNIILELNNIELIPSWLTKKMLYNEYISDTQEQKDIINTINNTKDIEIMRYQNKINDINFKLSTLDLKKKNILKKMKKKVNQIAKIDTHKKSFIFSLITFFIYNLCNSKNRRQRLEKIKALLDSRLSDIQSQINALSIQIKNLNEKITISKTNAKEQVKSTLEKIDALKLNYETQLSEVQTLDSSYQADKEFLPLKNYIGLDYELIIGCYIVHNVENDKYYVGQSKDVLKRIRQHFNGTAPKNVIFAEDYYKSLIDDKDKLFEIKIIKCETKDELDRTERQLIEDYDARNNGYNGTSGNI